MTFTCFTCIHQPHICGLARHLTGLSCCVKLARFTARPFPLYLEQARAPAHTTAPVAKGRWPASAPASFLLSLLAGHIPCWLVTFTRELPCKFGVALLCGRQFPSARGCHVHSGQERLCGCHQGQGRRTADSQLFAADTVWHTGNLPCGPVPLARQPGITAQQTLPATSRLALLASLPKAARDPVRWCMAAVQQSWQRLWAGHCVARGCKSRCQLNAACWWLCQPSSHGVLPLAAS